jgi:hypothetical protein
MALYKARLLTDRDFEGDEVVGWLMNGGALPDKLIRVLGADAADEPRELSL